MGNCRDKQLRDNYFYNLATGMRADDKGEQW